MSAVPDPAELKPSVDEVALIALRTRTVGYLPQASGLGGDTGPGDWTTFDDTTRPTATEVEMVIDSAYNYVVARLDMTLAEIPELAYGAVAHAVALYSAVLIEVSFFRETVNEALLTLWRDLMNEAIASVQGGGGSTPGVHYRMGTLVVGTTFDPVGPYCNSDFMPGIDDDDPYQQPIAVALGTPPHNRARG